MSDTTLQAALRAAFNSKISVIPQSLTEEQKTQSQTNIGGPFIPSSGGELTGSINCSSGWPIQAGTTDSFVTISSGIQNAGGAWFAVFGEDFSDSRKGAFTLASSNSTKALYGYPDGRLSWEGYPVARVVQKHNQTLTSSANTAVNVSLTLSTPIDPSDYTVTVIKYNGNGYATLDFCYNDKTSTNVSISFLPNGYLVSSVQVEIVVWKFT